MNTPNLNPVTRLCKSTFQMANGASFTVIHDIDAPVWDSLAARWQRKTKHHTSESLIKYIKGKKPHCICVTKAQYDGVTCGKAVPATKKEYDAEQPIPPPPNAPSDGGNESEGVQGV